jgi:tight adherence protein B
MNLVDLVTAGCFVCVLVVGIMSMILQDMRNKRPDALIRARVASFQADTVARHAVNEVLLAASQGSRTTRPSNALTRWLNERRSRLDTVSGRTGVRIIIATSVTAIVAAIALVLFAPLPSFAKPVVAFGLPIFVMVRTYATLVERFRRRFLEGFPDVIDLIVRAVRAGVPVPQVMATVAGECPEPLSSEFKRMGDSLQMGLDMKEVLDVATRRIQIADFSFFCVCLLLQRETGGQLGETLENLSGIVRTRREIRQKTKALTGEARITTKIMAAIPVVIVIGMYLINRNYVMVLFDTESGRHLITFAVMSTVIGVLIIKKMSNLDTSR